MNIADWAGEYIGGGKMFSIKQMYVCRARKLKVMLITQVA